MSENAKGGTMHELQSCLHIVWQMLLQLVVCNAMNTFAKLIPKGHPELTFLIFNEWPLGKLIMCFLNDGTCSQFQKACKPHVTKHLIYSTH